MLSALQTLTDNGLTSTQLQSVLNDLADEDGFEDDDDRRCCIALLYYYDNVGGCDLDDCRIVFGDTVQVANNEYRVLTDGEADAACAEYIKDSLWAFCSCFLSSETGIDKIVFEALADKCEDANDAVRSIIDGSCGIDSFIESAVSADGRGHYLSIYDGEENECGEFFVYRIN